MQKLCLKQVCPGASRRLACTLMFYVTSKQLDMPIVVRAASACGPWPWGQPGGGGGGVAVMDQSSCDKFCEVAEKGGEIAGKLLWST